MGNQCQSATGWLGPCPLNSLPRWPNPYPSSRAPVPWPARHRAFDIRESQRIPSQSPRVARNAKHGFYTDCGIALLLSGRIVRDCWMKRLLHPEVALGRPVRSRRADRLADSVEDLRKRWEREKAESEMLVEELRKVRAGVDQVWQRSPSEFAPI